MYNKWHRYWNGKTKYMIHIIAANKCIQDNLKFEYCDYQHRLSVNIIEHPEIAQTSTVYEISFKNHL